MDHSPFVAALLTRARQSPALRRIASEIVPAAPGSMFTRGDTTYAYFPLTNEAGPATDSTVTMARYVLASLDGEFTVDEVAVVEIFYNSADPELQTHIADLWSDSGAIYSTRRSIGSYSSAKDSDGPQAIYGPQAI